MSNGVKIGLLVVIAGALGWLTFNMINKPSDDIQSRPASEAAAATSGAPGSMNPNQVPGAEQLGSKSMNAPKTTWKFAKTEHDFGSINQGDAVEYKFKFTNTGNEPLVIEDAKGSCGCTVPSYPKEPVAPGAEGEILVKFNSAGKEGQNSKTVTLTANTEPISTILTIKANVEVKK